MPLHLLIETFLNIAKFLCYLRIILVTNVKAYTVESVHDIFVFLTQIYEIDLKNCSEAQNTANFFIFLFKMLRYCIFNVFLLAENKHFLSKH